MDRLAEVEKYLSRTLVDLEPSLSGTDCEMRYSRADTEKHLFGYHGKLVMKFIVSHRWCKV